MVLDPSSKQFIGDDEKYRERVRAYAGSLYEGLASLMTELVTLEDDHFVGGLLQRLYETDQDVWNLIAHIEDGRPK